MIFRKIVTPLSFGASFNFIFDLFYLSSELISAHLLRYSGIRGEIPPTRPNPLHPLSLDPTQPIPPISTRKLSRFANKSIFLKTIALILIGMFFTGCAGKTVRPHLYYGSAEARWVNKTLKRMTVADKIGQMICCRYRGGFVNRDSEYFQQLESLIVEYKIGGFVLSGGNVYAAAVLTNSLQQITEVPLLVAADLEKGLGNQLDGGTLFPPLMSVGATGSEELAYAMGRITAQEARAVGIHMTYAPVADVNSNPENPIINVRSLGENPIEVGRLAVAFIRGCQENGLIATAKHFPGHGDTAQDSHSVLPVISASRERLEKVELYPFRQAVQAGVMAVMTAHLRLPALDPTPDLPATLSRPILTDLLRKDMGFRGIIVTDAMEMRGITTLFSSEEAALKAVQAGADIILVPLQTEKVIQALIQAAEGGQLSEARINSSVRKILSYKARLGLAKTRLVELDSLERTIAPVQNLIQAVETFEKSLTLVQNDEDVLPLSAFTQRIAFFSLSSDPGGYYAGRDFMRVMQKSSPFSSFFYADAFTGKEYVQAAVANARKADVVVIALFSRLSAGKGSVDMNPYHIEVINQLKQESKPVVVVSFGSPYFLKHFPDVDAYLCAYRYTDIVQRAAASALLGELAITGKLPVSIPGLYPAGHGIILKNMK